MSTEKPGGTDKKPPEQPQPFRVNAQTRRIHSFSELPESVRSAIEQYEGRELRINNLPPPAQMTFEQSTQEAFEDLYISMLPLLTLMGTKENENSPYSSLVTTIIDPREGNLAGISIIFMENNKVIGTFLGRASDEEYRGVISPLVLAIRHRTLAELGIDSYTARLGEKSLKTYNRHVSYEKIESSYDREGQQSVRVTIDQQHTKQTLESLGIDYGANPFTTIYQPIITPLARP